MSTSRIVSSGVLVPLSDTRQIVRIVHARGTVINQCGSVHLLSPIDEECHARLVKTVGLSLMEALFLVERGSLSVTSGLSSGSILTSQDIYSLLTKKEMQLYSVYAYLKRLGYVVYEYSAPSLSVASGSSWFDRLVGLFTRTLYNPVFSFFMQYARYWCRSILFKTLLPRNKSLLTIKDIQSNMLLSTVASCPKQNDTIDLVIYKPNAQFNRNKKPLPFATCQVVGPFDPVGNLSKTEQHDSKRIVCIVDGNDLCFYEVGSGIIQSIY